MLDNLKKYHIILASNSPRRRQLLAGLCIDFEVKVLPDIAEDYPADMPVGQIAGYIAARKADAYKPLSPDEISYYVSAFRPLDKAGAYGIQEWIGYVGVTALKGSYFNVMGFPVQRVYSELQTL